MGLRLFEHPLSPYARKVKLLLYEKGIPFERVPVDPLRPSGEREYQEFVLASPRLEVPCLVDGKLRVFDSRIIADYVDERWPDPPMLPSSPEERARVRMIEEICDTQLDAIVWGLMEIAVFRRAQGELAERLRDEAQRQLGRIWSRFERELAGRRWMNGERFGRGDAAVLPHMGGPPLFGIPLPGSFPRLHEWLARCAERESVRREAAEVAAAARPWLEGPPPGGAPGAPLVRSYRNHRLEWMMRSGGTEVVLEGLARGTIRFSQEF
jgi:glutathione S-transferase